MWGVHDLGLCWKRNCHDLTPWQVSLEAPSGPNQPKVMPLLLVIFCFIWVLLSLALTTADLPWRSEKPSWPSARLPWEWREEVEGTVLQVPVDARAKGTGTPNIPRGCCSLVSAMKMTSWEPGVNWTWERRGGLDLLLGSLGVVGSHLVS